jgi:hypothetical protein
MQEQAGTGSDRGPEVQLDNTSRPRKRFTEGDIRLFDDVLSADVELISERLRALARILKELSN